jgi:hypothetical protein
MIILLDVSNKNFKNLVNLSKDLSCIKENKRIYGMVNTYDHKQMACIKQHELW